VFQQRDSSCTACSAIRDPRSATTVSHKADIPFPVLTTPICDGTEKLPKTGSITATTRTPGPPSQDFADGQGSAGPLVSKDRADVDPRALRYRPDVDGLRAVAVISVVLFHLSKRHLTGGFLGVDMFFVLSGYLITAIVWREMRQGRFSIIRFYDRRIRRIMPALLALLFFTTLASALLLLPSDLMGYSRSLLATLVFSANIYFLRDANYFSTAAEQKPLLHIWSLGIEEQFYVIFPLMLWLLARWWPARALTWIVVLTMGSLAACIGAAFVGAQVPAFFLLPTRAWELGVGAALALAPTHLSLRPMRAQWLAGAGALLILIGMVDPLDPYGYIPAAAPAVFGTALLLVSGQNNRPLMSRILEFRPLVFVGLISYSLYLWHWPIIVFGRYYLVRAFTLPEKAAAILLMTLCALASWRFVERPLRGTRVPIAQVRAIAGIAAVCLATVATGILSARGLPGRLGADAAVINQAVDTNYRCPVANYLPFGRSRACVMNLPSRNPQDADVILLGNSHAQMYEPVWESILAERGETGLLVSPSGCLPTVQANITRDCIDIAAKNLAAIGNIGRARAVIVGLNWWHGREELVDRSGRKVDNANDSAFETALDDLLDKLRRDGKQVVLIGPIAEPGWDIASVISRQLAFGHKLDRPTFLPASDFNRRFGPLIRHFATRNDIDFVRPDRVQCSATRCNFVLDGRSLFSDSNHIAAAELPRFRAMFEAALPSQL